MLDAPGNRVFEFRVSRSIHDKFKIPRGFWVGLSRVGLSARAVLQHSQLPPQVSQEGDHPITTHQNFVLWRSIAELGEDPAIGLKLVSQIELSHSHPISVAAAHSRSFREALVRMARYKQLCSGEEMRLEERREECLIELTWPFAEEPTPPALTDATFASVVELGRRGTGRPVNPKRVDLKRDRSPTHEAYFQCPVKFRARANALVFRVSDLDLPFVTHNPELVDLLAIQLDRQLAERKNQANVSDQVKSVLKRMLSGSQPDLEMVAHELGLGRRTLQRRIIDEGKTFRQLLSEARQELLGQYLADPTIGINEAAFLLGYQDPNSFYRAFRSWRGTSPAAWRHAEQRLLDG
jgi:AraC-like DNA-binding protein